jgi:hypothetical protein
MAMTGGCQCGEVRYECTGERTALYVCHCGECRKQSASAFGISVIVGRPDLRLTRGEPRSWTRGADSGRQLKCFFCGNCGSRLWHENDPSEEWVSVKGGSLDDPVDISNAVHIWTSRKQAGVSIPPQARQFPQEPD